MHRRRRCCCERVAGHGWAAPTAAPERASCEGVDPHAGSPARHPTRHPASPPPPPLLPPSTRCPTHYRLWSSWWLSIAIAWEMGSRMVITVGHTGTSWKGRKGAAQHTGHSAGGTRREASHARLAAGRAPRQHRTSSPSQQPSSAAAAAAAAVATAGRPRPPLTDLEPGVDLHELHGQPPPLQRVVGAALKRRLGEVGAAHLAEHQDLPGRAGSEVWVGEGQAGRQAGHWGARRHRGGGRQEDGSSMGREQAGSRERETRGQLATASGRPAHARGDGPAAKVEMKLAGGTPLSPPACIRAAGS